MACLACTIPADRALCQQCTDDLESWINEIVDRYLRLDPTPSTGGMDGGRRAPGFASRPPLNLHVATLRDPRTKPRRLGEPHNAHAMLNDWANYVRLERLQVPKIEAEIEGAARYLIANLDWLCRQEWIMDLWVQAEKVLAQLRSATGEPNPRPVGTCCDKPLYWFEGVAKCAGCQSTFSALDLLQQQLEAQEGASADGTV